MPWDTRHEGVRRILRLMVPALFGVSVSQINLLLDTVLASFLPTGSVSWLYYSDRLMELPLGVFGVAIATVILPSLSAHRAGARMRDFSLTLDWAVRSVLLIAVPAAAALALLAEPILITLFQYGAFEVGDVAMSAHSLRAYLLGLMAFMLIKVLAPGFYARQDTATPVKIGIVAMVANMLLNLAFVLPLMHFSQLGHVGLALATSVAAWLNAGLLWRGLRREQVYVFQPGWGVYLFRGGIPGHGRGAAVADTGRRDLAGLVAVAPRPAAGDGGAGRWGHLLTAPPDGWHAAVPAAHAGVAGIGCGPQVRYTARLDLTGR